MPGSASRVFQGLLKAALVISILVVALLTLLVAWWIALMVVGAWLLVTGARRLLRSRRLEPAARASTTIIDGEYRVEQHTEPAISPRIDESGGKHPKD